VRKNKKNKTADSHSEVIKRDREIKFLSPSERRLPWCRCYLPL